MRDSVFLVPGIVGFITGSFIMGHFCWWAGMIGGLLGGIPSLLSGALRLDGDRDYFTFQPEAALPIFGMVMVTFLGLSGWIIVGISTLVGSHILLGEAVMYTAMGVFGVFIVGAFWAICSG